MSSVGAAAFELLTFEVGALALEAACASRFPYVMLSVHAAAATSSVTAATLEQLRIDGMPFLMRM